mmetsp:Transcript_24382/g.40078  ORF Transcript_24382/g.40078 Transcript_24382/m.40078 type:complete len:556 (-) Transcript_24382:375-2042(-)|eukprot:CAMPEP_0184646526 /NCGR_PEP_ID=MMETSP0308-20130426/3221_1 /TAXON_ID=38269 /ORGANISM="Gloeochaete witrockiana, Strain SAG 46.84" /LENGTH=555 /DNA_ID=CAMNT_0027076595 /DNA_START=214 /DNA_END=1881 /DNA_ORIENTATION=-
MLGFRKNKNLSAEHESRAFWNRERVRAACFYVCVQLLVFVLWASGNGDEGPGDTARILAVAPIKHSLQRVGIVIAAVGPLHVRYAARLIRTAQKHLCKDSRTSRSFEYIVFTDRNESSFPSTAAVKAVVKLIPVSSVPVSSAALLRYTWALREFSGMPDAFDQLIFLSADSIFKAPVCEGLLAPFVAVRESPEKPCPYETDISSAAYIFPKMCEAKNFFRPHVIAGRPSILSNLFRSVSRSAHLDASWGRALSEDTHLNHYFAVHPPSSPIGDVFYAACDEEPTKRTRSTMVQICPGASSPSAADEDEFPLDHRQLILRWKKLSAHLTTLCRVTLCEETYVTSVRALKDYPPEKQSVLYGVARHPGVKTICEVGASTLGYSTALLLEAMDQGNCTRLYRFRMDDDIGRVSVTDSVEGFLRSMYPSRTVVSVSHSHWIHGVSDIAESIQCDLVIIGEQVYTELLLHVLRTLRPLCHVDSTMIVLDGTCNNNRRSNPSCRLRTHIWRSMSVGSSEQRLLQFAKCFDPQSTAGYGVGWCSGMYMAGLGLAIGTEAGAS